MTAPSVTFEGAQVALLAGILAASLPRLDDDDFEVADHLLEKALAALPRFERLGLDLAALRRSPRLRFLDSLRGRFPPGQPFDVIDAAFAAQIRPSRAFLLVEALASDGFITRLDDCRWAVMADEH